MSNTKSKNKYEEYILPNLELIKSWVRDGISEENISKKLNIAYSTFRVYKNRESALSAALKKGKEIYDNEVVEALHKNTLGGVVKVKKAVKLKEKIFEKGKLVKETEVIKMVEEEIYVKPDTLAQIYWLNNRRPEEWKNKPEVKESEEDKQNMTAVGAVLQALSARKVVGVDDESDIDG